MKNRILTAAVAAIFMFFASTPAIYAFSGGETAPTDDGAAVVGNPVTEYPVGTATSAQKATATPTAGATVTATPTPTPNPFTPSGAGTVIDQATDTDGKEFYTIKAPDDSVFYLVIDRQRGQENVYFLNAVTVEDLMPLAEASDTTGVSETPQAGIGVPSSSPSLVSPSAPATGVSVEPTPSPETPTAPETQQGGVSRTPIIIIALIIIGGGAAWYFKIYRPKRRGGAETCYAADSDGADDWGNAEDDGGSIDGEPSWSEDDEQ